MQKTLYRQEYEHDACGIGAVVNIDGKKSHSIVSDALSIVEKLEHRAGKDATGEVGDGVGVMLQISHSFFGKLGLPIGKEKEYGVGMFFFPQESLKRKQAQKLFEVICQNEGVEFLCWREVPVNPDILGKVARDSQPVICQCFVKRPADIEWGIDFDRKLYVIRRVFEHSCEGTYVCSLSSRTIVYKGMFLVGQLRKFYSDLQDESYESAIAMVHSRFSTNTTPSWERAHPNRMILHNGEINTIRGNVDRMIAREETMHSSVMENDISKVLPVISATGSDSAMLDNSLEFMTMNGIPLPLAVMIAIPEPWRMDADMPRNKKDLYRYYATMMEPWDGPAAILFSDGELMGAVLDRNGLRPARYYITKDRRLILSSEVGVLDIPAENIVCKSRLQPGKMLLVDTNKGEVISDDECKKIYAQRQPYGEWLDTYLVHLEDLAVPKKKVPLYDNEQRSKIYKAFGYTYEDVTEAILPMARDGIEKTAAMGSDIPLAVLSEKHQPLFNYFKQLFAQVTNPPIDSLREEIVTDTTVYVGCDGNLLQEKAENCRVLQIDNPILTSVELMKIRHMNKPGFRVETVSLLHYKNSSLEGALEKLFIEVDRAYLRGANIIILSDRGVDEYHVAIPSLLAVSAVEQHLIRTKKRTAVSIILESAEPRDVHHFATLLGYGARAINPYLAQECIKELVDTGRLDKDVHE
ncbi:MAG: glutamate synthase central domain-containing protein, partial [Clostridia bacterium]|nr:glutamate synthase central domain-containing protein [Clostridia bacterium]